MPGVPPHDPTHNLAAFNAVPGSVERDGLTSSEAAARLRADGPNLLPVPPRPPVWRLLVAQLAHFFALMLWVASVLAYIAGLPQLTVAICVVILLNGVFAFAQEYRAEGAAERLRDLLPRRASVVRDGALVEIDASQLVVDDLVWLSAGDRVSADLTTIESHSLSIDSSMLTGETVPVVVAAGALVFAGTFVVQGEALAVVTATAGATRLASIARIVRETRRPESPLALELNRVVRVVAAIAIGVGVSFFAISLLVGTSLTNGFLFAVGVTVALVPEGLLPTVTLALALGAQRMAGRHALVRRLESVETLGSTTFICTDKTGTLTRNEMEVVEVWTPHGGANIHGQGYDPVAEIEAKEATLPHLRDLALAAARCSTGRALEEDGRWIARGDPMEAALDALARRLAVDVDSDRHERPIAQRYPFDTARRRMSVVAGGWLLVKGAPDTVLPLCRDISGPDEAFHDLARRGLRVLAIARRPALGTAGWATADAAERDLELLGLVGLEDPPREGAAEAIATCRQAGIRVAMLTGDYPATAAAIARDVGLLQPGGAGGRGT